MNASLRHKGLIASSLFVAMAIPLLVFGKSLIGIALGLAFVIALVCGDHGRARVNVIQLIGKNAQIVLGLVVVASALNIPFSLRPELSFEAWVRTWVMFFAIFYLICLLEDYIDLIVKFSVCLVFIVLLGLSVHFVLIEFTTYFSARDTIAKIALNALLINTALFILFFRSDQAKIWQILSGLSVFFLLFSIFERSSKASLAGAILVSLAVLLLIGSRLYSWKKVTVIFVLFLGFLTMGLSLWLPSHLNESSLINMDAAFLPVWLIDFHRQLIWLFSIELSLESLWTGFGLNASNYHDKAQIILTEYFADRYPGLEGFQNDKVLPGHPHNWILEILLDGGVILLGPLFIGVVWLILHPAVSYFKTGQVTFLSLVGVHVAFWGVGLLNVSFWSTWWQASYGLMASLCYFSSIKPLNEKIYN